MRVERNSDETVLFHRFYYFLLSLYLSPCFLLSVRPARCIILHARHLQPVVLEVTKIGCVRVKLPRKLSESDDAIALPQPQACTVFIGLIFENYKMFIKSSQMRHYFVIKL